MAPLSHNQKRSEEFFEEVLRPYAKDFIVSACVIDLSNLELRNIFSASHFCLPAPSQPRKNDHRNAVSQFKVSKKEPKIFGYRMDEFVYPASCYKVFIGAEVLRRIEACLCDARRQEGDFSLQTIIEVKSPNNVDEDARIFPEDSRPLLKTGDRESVDRLLDLMLTRSDNTAANCLIDLVSRESITENIIRRYGWAGSEVTRKFLDRAKEGKPYRFSESTMSCPRHLAEFFSLVEKNEMVSPFVSEKLKSYMMKRNSARGFMFHPPISFYGKSGWLETNFWEISLFSALKNILRGKWAVIRWSHDVGVVQNDDAHFVVCVMSISKSWHPWHRFPIKKIGDATLDFMSE